MNSLKTLIPYTDPDIDYHIWPGFHALRRPLLSVVLITATDLEAANHQNLGAGTIGTLVTTIRSPDYRRYPLSAYTCPLRDKLCKVRSCGQLNQTCKL